MKRFRGQKHLQWQNISFVHFYNLLQGKSGRNVGMHPVVIQVGKQLEASIPVAHFCCWFFRLNFVVVFTENNLLSENTWNTSKNVVILRI